MKKIRIRIANPIPGEALFTSEKRALEFLNAGLAVLNDAGELVFDNRIRVKRVQRQEETDFHIRANRGGVVYWNGGGDRDARMLPGWVRS